jgi:hypothetical protein
MCRAHMQDATPKQYTYDRVYVRSAAFVHIRAVAHYKTSDTTKFGKTDRTGHGSARFYISGATPGYRVWVDVWLTKGGRHGHCRTSFVPHQVVHPPLRAANVCLAHAAGQARPVWGEGQRVSSGVWTLGPPRWVSKDLRPYSGWSC